MKGLDCYANGQALENAARKELGIPTVGISPGDTRAPGVLEPGVDLNKIPMRDWYTATVPPDVSAARAALEVLTGGGYMVDSVTKKDVTTASGSVETKYPLFGFDPKEARDYLKNNVLLDSKILDAVP
eukprot:jgi/Mesvir1/26915/Mv20642-RA.1